MSVFRRLFNDHPGVTFLLGAFWILFACVSLAEPEDPRHAGSGLLLLSLAALTVLVSFAWSNSGHYQQVESALKRRSLVWATAIADFIVFAILFSIPAGVLVPAYGNYAIRARMAGMMSAASSLKSPITESALAKGTLKGAASELKAGTLKNADYALLSPDGVIVAYNERHGALLVMTPTLSGNGVAWRCQGYPPKLFPATCRGEAK